MHKTIKAVIAIALIAGIGPAIGQGSAGTGNTSTGVGSQTEVLRTWHPPWRSDPTTRQSNEHDRRNVQPQPRAKELDPVAKYTAERAARSEMTSGAIGSIGGP